MCIQCNRVHHLYTHPLPVQNSSPYKNTDLEQALGNWGETNPRGDRPGNFHATDQTTMNANARVRTCKIYDGGSACVRR